jgi:hypothetical protein
VARQLATEYLTRYPRALEASLVRAWMNEYEKSGDALPELAPSPSPSRKPSASSDRLAEARTMIANPDTVDDGVRLLERLAKEGGSVDAWYWLAAGYLSQGEEALACKAFATYLKKAPNGQHAKNAQANVDRCE